MVNPLVSGLDWGTRVFGQNITYYFEAPGEYGSAGMLKEEKAAFKQAFTIYESFINVHFFQVDQAAKANFNILTITDDPGSLGSMRPPGYSLYAGFGLFNYEGVGWGGDGLKQGGLGFVTVIHELGHALGLAHPHDDGGNSTISPGVTGPFDSYGDFDLNQGIYTTMSYNDGWQTNPDGPSPSLDYGRQATPMALDIFTLQQKYGVNNAYHYGNDKYFLPTVNDLGTFYSCIWDAHGKDIIINPGDLPSIIDLREATLKLEYGGGGFLSYADGIFGEFTIAKGAVIENARGGSADDYLQGNDAKNMLRGGDGDDQLFGGENNDQLFGGDGLDELTGGNGADRFVFNTTPGAENIDAIDDFDVAADLIVLSRAIFTGLAKGALSAAAFVVGSAAGAASQHVIYDDTTGALSFDADGNGGGAAVQFATLDTGLVLTAGHFLVVA